jgi:hypothetical protein
MFQNNKEILSSLSNLNIRLYPENPFCLICGKKTYLLKTDGKTCYSFELGKFTLISGYNFCDDHKYFSEPPNQVIRYESDLAALIVDKGYRVAFDLVVKIGRFRFDNHRQLQEIQAFLKCSLAEIDLPISTIGVIAKRFLEFCKLFHKRHESEIRADIQANGGYFLHFDGSTEQRCGQCSLILLDSRSGHVLESIMVESEKYDIVKTALEKVKTKYGAPLAIISDLRAGFLRACTGVFGKDILHILCHYHFLRTFRDDFKQQHLFIKKCQTKKWQLQAGIRKQWKSLKEIKPKAGYPKKLKTIAEIEKYWDKTGDILGAYRYVLVWVLNFKQDSSGKGVPFDLPYLDLFNRFITGKKLIEQIFTKAPIETRFKYYRHGFCTVVKKTKKLGYCEPGFRKAIRQLEYAHKWFNKLRAVLFLEAQVDNNDHLLAPLSKKYRLTKEEAGKIPQRLEGYIKALEKELSKCKNPDRKSLLERFKKQVETYQNNLHVPVLTIIIDGKEILLVPPRTNNCLESFFRFVKSLLRRCTGCSKLPKVFGSVGALLPYYLTMKDHKIFKNIFNDDYRLAEEFSKLFAKQFQPPENLISFPKKSTNIVNEMPPIALLA